MVDPCNTTAASEGALASALRSSGATIPVVVPMADAGADQHVSPAPEAVTRPVQPSRRDTKPITVHFPREVRKQLKALAAEQDRFVDDMVAEALNLLFVRYKRPEIAPRKS